MNAIDRMTYWTAQRYHTLRHAFKLGEKRVPPPYLSGEIARHGVQNIFLTEEEVRNQRLSTHIPWIYSTIERIASEVSAADYQVFKVGTQEKDINHPFEKVFRENKFFGRESLLSHVIWGLSISPDGAYWFLAPDSTGQLCEIWPVPIGRLKPVKDKTEFIRKYLYTPLSNPEKPILIDPKFIARFFYFNPFDLWGSLTPLQASQFAIKVYTGIETSQIDTFTESRGVPLSVLSLDENISEPDFAAARQRLREDWENHSRIAIVRAGSLNVQNVGLSSKDLDIVASQAFNRDELDSVFMGFPWRSDKLLTGEGLRELNKTIKDVVIHPLHKIVQGMNNNILYRLI